MRKRTADQYFWWIAITVFVAMTAINYLPVFSGKIPFPRDLVLRHSAWNGQPQEQVPQLIDIIAMFYPFRSLLGRGAKEGTLPLWNPHIMSGAPFQANAQSALFAPLNILYYALPLKAAWTASLAIRLFLAAIFMTLFLRSIGGSATGSILSGILFALCGFTVEWQGQSNGDSCVWLPLIFYSVYRLHRKLDSPSIAIAGFAFAMPLLSGHPETAAHSTLAASAMALFIWIFPLRSGARRFETRFALAFVLSGFLALGLASVQMIPTIEWLGQLGLQVEAPQPVLDRHQGQGLLSRDITRDPSSALVSIPEGSAYVGMLGLLAASLAFFYPSRRLVYFFAGIAVLSAAVAYGVQPVRWIVVHLPVIKAMKNGRLILVTDFALAAMAGLGISAIGPHLDAVASRMRRHAMMLIGAAFMVLSFCVYEVHRATLTSVELSRSPLASLVFLIAGFIVIAGTLYGNPKGLLFPVAICGLAGLEMLSFSYGYLGFASAGEVFPPAPVLEFLQTRHDSEPFRVAKDRFPIPHDAGMIYGFESADGYDLTTERTRMFTGDLIEDREDGVIFFAEKILAVHDRRFDMLNVRYLMVSKPGPQFDSIAAQPDRFVPVFSQASVAVFENKTALGRFLSVPLQGIEVIAEPSAQMSRLRESSFDPERSVIFSDPPAGDRAETSLPAPLEARIKVVEKGINGDDLRVQSNAPAVIVVSQMYYPGWKATVDGEATQVYPVDVALTGIIVPAGAHDVRLFFQPTSFRIGFLISLVSAVVACLLLIRGYRRPSDHFQSD